MDFTISEEVRSAQQLAQQILGDFTSVEKLKVVEKQEERFDTELWHAMAEAGLLGLDIGENHGGTELGFFSLTTLCEEVGRTVAPVPVIPVLVSAAGTLRRFAGDTQKDQWLPGIAGGTTLISAALGEYNNDDPTAPQSTAEQKEGGYSISGTKICVSLARSAARILVSARMGEELVVALVDPRAAGITLNAQIVTTGETQYEVVMNKVQVPASDVVAVGGEALAAMTWAQQATRTALAAMALGVCDKMMRITGQYTSERQQFGRAIATFQAVSHRVADCYIDVECLRLVTQQAAALIDQGRPAEDAKACIGLAYHRRSRRSDTDITERPER